MQSVQAVAIIIGKGGRGIQHGHSIRGLKLSMVPIAICFQNTRMMRATPQLTVSQNQLEVEPHIRSIFEEVAIFCTFFPLHVAPKGHL